MSITIKDGLTGITAHVNSENRLTVDAAIESQLERHSESTGSAAYWYSTYSATGGEEVLYIQNTESVQKLHITRVQMSSTVLSLWTLIKVNAGLTAGGTGLVYVNPNLSSGVVKQHNSFGTASVTGSIAGDTIYHGSMDEVARADVVDFEGSLILGNTDAIAIALVTTGVIHAQVWGYWNEDE